MNRSRTPSREHAASTSLSRPAPSLEQACARVVARRLKHDPRRAAAWTIAGAAVLLTGTALVMQSADAEFILNWNPTVNATPNDSGSGNWDYVSPYWFNPATGTDIVWPDTTGFASAVFGGVVNSPATVNITAAGVTANSVTFNNTGTNQYTLQGGPLKLEQAAGSPIPTLHINSSATINSNISGSHGFIMDGQGTLNLNGASSISGTIYMNDGQLILNNPTTTFANVTEVVMTGSSTGASYGEFDGGGNFNQPGPFFGIQDNGAAGGTAQFANTSFTLNGGTIYYHGGPNNGNPSVTLPKVTVNTSAFINGQPQGGGGDIAITNLIVAPTATMTFESAWAPIGSGPVGTDIGKVFITNLNGAAPTLNNGMLGGQYTAVSNNNGGSQVSHFATYGANGIQELVTDIGTDINTAGALSNYEAPGGGNDNRGGLANHLVQDSTVYSLTSNNRVGYGDTFFDKGTHLTVASGGVIIGGAGHWFVEADGAGALAQITAGPQSQIGNTGNYNLFVTVNDGTSPWFSGVVVADYKADYTVTDPPQDPPVPSVPVNLVKGGVGQLVLNHEELNTGAVIINAGSLLLNSGGQANSPLAHASSVTVNGGATLNLGSVDALGYFNHEQSAVTINEGGTLRVLNGGRTSQDRDLNVIGGTVTSENGNFDSNASYAFRDYKGAITTFTSAPVTGRESTLSAKNIGIDTEATFVVNRGGGAVDLNVTGNFLDVFGGPHNVKWTGNGITTLRNATSTYTGATMINGGTVIAMGDVPSGAAGIFGNATSSIRLGSDAASGGSRPTLLIGGDFTIGRGVDIQNQPVANGAGYYVLGNSTAGNSTFSAPITTAQPLQITSSSTGANSLNFTAGISSTNGLQTLTFAGPGNTSVGVLGVPGSGITDGTGSIAVVVTGGTTTLTGPSNYGGSTTITGGTLILKTSNSNTGSDLSLAVGGTLDLFGNTATFANFAGTGGTITNNGSVPGTLIAQNSAATSTYAGVIKDGLFGGAVKTTALTYSGAGTLRLTGANTFTGATTINSGTLALVASSANNISGSTTVSVNSGGVLDVTGLTGNGITLTSGQNLNGAGTVMGSVTTAAGSFLSPGLNSSPSGGSIGTLTVGNLTISTGTTLDFLLGTPGTTSAPGMNTALISVNGNLTLPSSGINVNFLGGLASGTYELFGYTGALSGFNASTFSANTVGKTFTFISNPALHQIDVTVATLGLIFAGGPGSTANFDTTTQNFANGTTPTAFSNGQTVTFQDANPLNPPNNVTSSNITVDLGGVSPGGVLFANDVVNYQIGGGAIQGTSGISKAGVAKVTLTAANTFNGPVTISQGSINIQNNAALGNSSGVTVSSGAALQLQGGITTSNAIPLVLNGTGLAANPLGALENVSGSNTYTGPITLATGSSVGATNAADELTLSGAIGGPGKLTITGAGIVNVSGAANYTGGTAIDSGTLNAIANVSGAYSSLKGSVANNSQLRFTVSNGASAALNSTTLITGTGSTIVTSGAGGGTLVLGVANQLSGAGPLIVQNGVAGTTLDLHGYSQMTGPLAGSGTITSNSGTAGSATLTVGGSSAADFSGTITNAGSDALNLTLNSSSTQTLSGANTYSGNTTITNGGLILGNQNAVQNSNVVLTTAQSGTNLGLQFQSGIGNFSVGALTGTSPLSLTDVSGGAVNLTLGNANGTFSGALTQGATASSLTKVGAGTQVLTGVNQYTGDTNVLGGTLQIGPGQINGTGGNITVGGTGTLALTQTDIWTNASNAPINNFTNNAMVLTLNVGGKVTSNGRFNQLQTVAFNGGALVANGGANSSFGAYGLQGTINAGTAGIASTASAIYQTTASPYNFIDLGVQNTVTTTVFNVAQTGSTIADFVVAIPVNDNGNQIGNTAVSSLTKVGPGSLALAGGGWYSGGTDVQEGTLIVGGTVGKGAVNLGAGTSLVVDASKSAYTGAGNLGGGLAGQYISTNGTPGNHDGGNVDKNLFATLDALQNLFATQPLTTGRTEPTLNVGLAGGNLPPLYANTNSNNFAMLSSGILNITTGGSYIFGTNSDDGSVIYIDGVLVVNNNNYQGVGGNQFQVQNTVPLTAGQHSFVEGFYQGVGGYGVFTGVSGPDTGNVVKDLAAGNIGITPDAVVQTLTGTGNVVLNTGNLIVGGSNEDTVFGGIISGADGIQKVGTGTLTLTGANTYGTGVLPVNTTVTSGTLQVGDGGTSGQLGGGNITNNGTIAFNRSGTIVVSGSISGTGALNQMGAGTTQLDGQNTYIGATNVTSGTLTVRGSIASSNLISVSNGATLASGNNTTAAIGDAVLAGGGILAPGSSGGTTNSTTLGQLNVTGDLILGDGLSTPAHLQIEIGGLVAGSLYDNLSIDGELNLNLANLDVSFANGFVPSVGQMYTIATFTSLQGLFANTLTEAGTGKQYIVSQGARYDVDYAPDQITLEVAVVPEPASFATLLAGLGMLTSCARLRRRAS